MISRQEAYDLVLSLVDNKNLVKHMLCVEACLQDYAERLGQNKDIWGITGLLHDADWEKYPEIHPKQIVKILNEKNEQKPGYAPEEMIHAIASHGNGEERFVKRETLLDHYLYACDEISGFVVAYSLMNPDKLGGIKAEGVIKKLKDKAFAKGVNRDDIYEGVEAIGVPLEEHVQNVINSLLRIRTDLGL
jgi:predicted hydrolase (HD superfamily)